MDQNVGKVVSDDTSLDFTVRHGIDLNDCVEDSPDLREHLENHEKEISELEASLERMVQLCSSMVSAGHKYNQSWREFGMHLKEMGAHFSTNEKVVEIFKTTSDLFSGLSTYYSVMFDQVQRSVQNAVKNFLVCEIGKLRESKRHFDRTAEEFNSALHKNASSPKSKPAEAEEASKTLQASTVNFSVVAMDHAYQINCLQSKKGYEVLEKMVSMARALLKFFTDGNDTMKKFEPTIEQMGTEIDVMKKEAVIEGKKMERRGSLVKKVRVSADSSGAISSLPLSSSSSEGELQESVALRGFLFKRNSSKFKMWNRRYFIMKDNQLQYLKKGPTKEMHTIAEDLRLCAVKNMEDIERRFCFEIVAPTKSFLLQADSDVIRKKWMVAIQASIASAFRQSMSASTAVEGGVVAKGSPLSSTTTDPSRVTRRLMRVAGNDKCADCGSINPTWASINIGVLLCIECSGIHRSLGVHISKVRSVTLDAWEPEVLRVMIKLGNNIANSILEYVIPTGMVKPVANSPRPEKEQWIKAKYVQHKFVHPHISVPETSTTPIDIPSTPELQHRQMMTQSLASINRPFNSTEDFLADDSAPESEYDSKSLKRKKKQNKIRRWAMDKIVKRAANSVREGIGIIGRESPSVPADDEISIGESQQDLAGRTLSLKERKSTFSVGEMPPPKPPRSHKTKSVLLEKAVMEPLLSGEDPMSGDWYKGGSLFEKEDFCDSILEVIKNIGYTCESPGSSMLQSDTEAPAALNGVNQDNCDGKKNEEEVIANDNFLEESMEATSPAKKRQSGNDFTDDPSGGHIYEEIPDEFQRYSAEDDTDNTSGNMYEEVVTSLNARVKEKSVSASDVSLEFFSAHSSPTNSFDIHSSPMIPENSEPVYTQVRKPAKKLESTAWNSEESSSGVVSCTSVLQESPPSSKSSAGVSEIVVTDTSPSADVTSSKETSPGEVSQEQNSTNVEVTNLEPESVAGPPDSDTAQDTTETNPEQVSTSQTVTAVDKTATFKRINSIESPPSSGAPASGQTNEACSTPASEHDTGPPCTVVETTSNTPSIEEDNVTEGDTTVVANDASGDATTELRTSNGLVKVSDGSPVMARLLLPVVDNADLFTSDDELDDTRALNTPEPVIIPLTKTAHEYLYSSAKGGNIPGMLCALVHGANVNFMNPEEELKCPLITSILAENLESTEFLLQNGAKLHLRDSRGRGCLHHAADIGAIGHVCLLLKRGTVAHLHSLDEMGKDALDIAVEKCNADIVTLLRLAKLNDDSETVDERQNKTLQDTVNLVYRDIKVNDSLIDSPSSTHPPSDLATSTAQQ